MAYANDEIIEALKSARAAKGLSQRALSVRTGVPQSHISKIEAGQADIRLSSLIEIARALELDLKLVPRKAVPAVDSIVRNATPRPASPADKTLAKEIGQSLAALDALRVDFPALEAARTLRENLQLVSKAGKLDLNLARIREITKPLRQIQDLIEQQKAVGQGLGLPPGIRAQLDALADVSRQLRNRAVRGGAADPGAPRPAYRLDDVDDDDRDGDDGAHHDADHEQRRARDG